MTSEQGGRNSDTFYLFILKDVYGNYYLFVFLFIFLFLFLLLFKYLLFCILSVYVFYCFEYIPCECYMFNNKK